MEITKIVVIVILALLVVIEALIIWGLSITMSDQEKISNHRQILLTVYRELTDVQRNETRSWKNAYIKEKRQSDHKSRKIESIYRGQLINQIKEIVSKAI